MSDARRVSLFRDEGSQVVRIPRGFELPGTEAVVRRRGSGLVVEPVPQSTLLEWLDGIEPMDESWPEMADSPPRDVE